MYKRGVGGQTSFKFNQWKLGFDALTGSVNLLTAGSNPIAWQNHQLLRLEYKRFDENDVDRSLAEYGYVLIDWYYRDFGKVGLGNGHRIRANTILETISVNPIGDEFVVKICFPDLLHGSIGTGFHASK